ncbi:uncharacterized protein BDW70DRAFT_163857 [Aspergillus foveolatus]|uniref:uncharacterized protein n=1 Tax=Aspergillus foveolatus TaxID=210207 RepID=UPI003CCE0126
MASVISFYEQEGEMSTVLGINRRHVRGKRQIMAIYPLTCKHRILQYLGNTLRRSNQSSRAGDRSAASPNPAPGAHHWGIPTRHPVTLPASFREKSPRMFQDLRAVHPLFACYINQVCDYQWKRFPYHPTHPYRPKKADLNDLLAFQKSQGIAYSCLVAFSVYGTHNSRILDALRCLDGKGRAVVCIDPQTVTDTELQELHNAGTRGIRLNFRTSRKRVDKAKYVELLIRAADTIRPFGWILQLYVSLEQIALLASVVPRLGVPVVIDHIGHPERPKGPPRVQEGYHEFMELLGSGLVYTKLSGSYRFDDLPELDAYVQELLAVAPDRVVWASDWLHSGGVSMKPDGDRNKVQEYRKVDDQAWIVQCRNWCRLVGGKRRALW